MTKKFREKVLLTDDIAVSKEFHKGTARAIIEDDEILGLMLTVYDEKHLEEFESESIPIDQKRCNYRDVNRIVRSIIGKNRKYFLDISHLSDLKEICPDFYKTATEDPEITKKKKELQEERELKYSKPTAEEKMNKKREKWMY